MLNYLDTQYFNCCRYLLIIYKHLQYRRAHILAYFVIKGESYVLESVTFSWCQDLISRLEVVFLDKLGETIRGSSSFQHPRSRSTSFLQDLQCLFISCQSFSARCFRFSLFALLCQILVRDALFVVFVSNSVATWTSTSTTTSQVLLFTCLPKVGKFATRISA